MKALNFPTALNKMHLFVKKKVNLRYFSMVVKNYYLSECNCGKKTLSINQLYNTVKNIAKFI